ncbi:MAG: aminoglycoside phosphotransferase family protein [Ancrocorticia sp.]
MRSTPDISNPNSKQPNPGTKQPDLSTEQSAWLLGTVRPVEVVGDLSWDTTTSRVWHLRDSNGTNLILKGAGPPMEKHIAREIRAHETAARELSRTSDTQRLVAGDSDLGILVLTYLRGKLVEGTDFEFDPEVHFQAGQLLGRLHRQGSQVAPPQAAQSDRQEEPTTALSPTTTKEMSFLATGSASATRSDDDGNYDDDYERNLVTRTRWWLSGEHNIPASQVAQINAILDTCTPGPIRLVPTHGDWHPRNWLVDDSGATLHVMAIDFGRFDWRSPQSDILRLQLMQWNGRPDLEEAFFRGYGEDPRTNSWQLELVYQAVANACWAHMMGDMAFEQQGLREISMILETAPE